MRTYRNRTQQSVLCGDFSLSHYENAMVHDDATLQCGDEVTKKALNSRGTSRKENL
jgi:hypothetical protein